MQDVEREGRKVTSQRDPPGQRSVYVPPGKYIKNWQSGQWSSFQNNTLLCLRTISEKHEVHIIV